MARNQGHLWPPGRVGPSHGPALSVRLGKHLRDKEVRSHHKVAATCVGSATPGAATAQRALVQCPSFKARQRKQTLND